MQLHLPFHIAGIAVAVSVGEGKLANENTVRSRACEFVVYIAVTAGAHVSGYTAYFRQVGIVIACIEHASLRGAKRSRWTEPESAVRTDGELAVRTFPERKGKTNVEDTGGYVVTILRKHIRRTT